MYQQNYDPLGNPLLSIVAAAVPIATLLYFIALHPHRDQHGRRQLGISAPRAALCGVIAAFVVSLLVMRMPLGTAVSSFAAGALNGVIGIVWIIVGAMLLYTITVLAGKFEVVKESITQVLGLAALTRYAGTDAVLGLAFTVTGPFSAARSPGRSQPDPGSSHQLDRRSMGKMIDAQSITVATVGAAFIGVVAILQAYIFPGMIPPMP